MGLLDFMNSDEARMGIGLLAAGGYQPTKMTFGQRVAQALQGDDARKKEALQAMMLNAQLEDIKNKGEFEKQQRPFLLTQAEAKANEAKTEADILKAFHTARFGSGGPQSVSGGQGGTLLPPDGGGSVTGVPMQSAGGSMGYGITANNANSALALPPDIALGLLHPRTKDLAKAEADRIKLTDKMRELIASGVQPGSQQWNTALTTLATQGGLWQPQAGGGYAIDPGYVAGQGAVKQAEEEAKARMTPFKVDPLDPNSPPTVTSVYDMLRGGAQPQASRPLIGSPRPTLPTDGAPTMAASSPQEKAAYDAVAANLSKGITGSAAPGGQFRPSIALSPAVIPSNAVGMSPSVAASQKAREAALTKKADLDAVDVSELQKKIPSLYSTISRLDKMEVLTKDDKTFAAAGAELKSDLGRIAQAFGLKVNAEKTANTESYMAHVAELLKERLASKDYGSGTGISNVDLISAKEPLPKVANTAVGRLKIIDALRKDAKRAITDNEAAVEHFAQYHEMTTFKYPSAVDPGRITEMRRTKDGRVLIKRASGAIEEFK